MHRPRHRNRWAHPTVLYHWRSSVARHRRTGLARRPDAALAIVGPPAVNGTRLTLPFVRKGGLYEWRVTIRLPSPSSAANRGRCLAIHASKASHHIDVMSPSDAILYMHRRLHAGASRLRALPSITADAPPAITRGHFNGCNACTEANATRLPHESQLYQPSHAGRLVHTDIAGPF
eukprot:3388082-Pleurochrysis_carterae.AAC.2